MFSHFIRATRPVDASAPAARCAGTDAYVRSTHRGADIQAASPRELQEMTLSLDRALDGAWTCPYDTLEQLALDDLYAYATRKIHPTKIPMGALARYMEDAEDCNSTLRGLKPGSPECLDDILDIDRALASIPNERRPTLFRCATAPPSVVDGKTWTLRPGLVVQEGGYLSLTPEPMHAEFFMRAMRRHDTRACGSQDDRIVITYVVDHAEAAKNLSRHFPSNFIDEKLMARGQNFLIKSVARTSTRSQILTNGADTRVQRMMVHMVRIADAAFEGQTSPTGLALRYETSFDPDPQRHEVAARGPLRSSERFMSHPAASGPTPHQ